MRRVWVIVILVFAAASAAAYQRGSHWKEFRFTGTRLMADLGHPDALIRTASLSRMPRDLLRVPIARDVLTEDLVFYYEQHEDRLGVSGAIKRIAYEHQLAWTDRILASALDEPAEVALWRDGKGALRHYAIVMRRSALARVLQEAATVALKDSQLKSAGEIALGDNEARVLSLELNPRRTLLIVSQGERIVVLSDPGLLFGKDNAMVPEARAAVAGWLQDDAVLARQFALDGARAGAAEERPTHTFVIGAPTLALGYGSFLPGFKGIRFDFGGAWSTSLWLDQKSLPSAGLGGAALWRAAPANPGACVVLPVDWNAARKVVGEAETKPKLPDNAALAALDGAALACWYGESNLYSPVFIARLGKRVAHRDAALEALAAWAIASGGEAGQAEGGKSRGKADTLLWRSNGGAAVGARDAFVVFSPDAALVEKVLDTIGRSNPSVADQMPTSDATLALMTPRPLSAMAEREVLAALDKADDANLLAAAQTHLPARMRALASYPPYRLELAAPGPGDWQPVQWRTAEKGK